MIHQHFKWIVLTIIMSPWTGTVFGDNYFLTIGGGYSPEGNQASLERNVLYFQQLLKEQDVQNPRHDIFFADGNNEKEDLQVIDRNSVPLANQLMADFFGSEDDLGLHYRNHQIPGVRAATSPDAIRVWFQQVGRQMKDGDRLLIYVTAHGGRSADRRDEFETTIEMWNNASMKMSEFVSLLDQLPQDVDVVTIMVQCFSGGFSRMIFNGGDSDRGVSQQQRCGFFATVHDREAAGCTAEIDDASYVEYSTYFWNALSGHDRLGNPIDPPDYNTDGKVSFEEAHAYTVLTANTIDLPVKTSGEFLSTYSIFGNNNRQLLTNEEPYSTVLNLANSSQKAVLEGLSEQLELTGENRLVNAWRATETNQNNTRNSRGRRTRNPLTQLRNRIAGDLEATWPELANLLNPVAIELVTTRSEEFVAAVEAHPAYKRYRELKENQSERRDPEKRIVKFERFLRIADNVILEENLRRLGDQNRIRQFESIVAAEGGFLTR